MTSSAARRGASRSIASKTQRFRSTTSTRSQRFVSTTDWSNVSARVVIASPLLDDFLDSALLRLAMEESADRLDPREVRRQLGLG